METSKKFTRIAGIHRASSNQIFFQSVIRLYPAITVYCNQRKNYEGPLYLPNYTCQIPKLPSVHLHNFTNTGGLIHQQSRYLPSSTFNLLNKIL